MKLLNYIAVAGLAAVGLAPSARADLTHEYSFNGNANDSVGTANGTLFGSVNGGITFSGGQLRLNNNYGTAGSAGNYLALPATILPSSGSATIEEWFTFTGSGYNTQAFAFSNGNHDANPPGASSGQYLMGTISAPQGGPNAANAGGSHIGQTLAGYGGGAETDAFETTAGIGAGGAGYLDNGATFMMACVIDGTAGTMSYYLNGILQQTITAIPLSSFSFTDAYLGRSAFPGDANTLGSIDEFRTYNNAQSGSAIQADYTAGPNVVVVPEPGTLALMGLGSASLLLWRRRKI